MSETGAENFFANIQAEKAFIGVSGILDDLSLTTGLLMESMIKRSMIAAARKIIVVAGADKFSRRQMFRFCSADRIDTMIVSGSIPESTAAQIEACGIKLVMAGAGAAGAD